MIYQPKNRIVLGKRGRFLHHPQHKTNVGITSHLFSYLYRIGRKQGGPRELVTKGNDLGWRFGPGGFEMI